MEIPITFGEWLRQARNQLRLTREEFASRVGFSVSALRKIEDGERRPSSQIAELIANCLNVPPAERAAFVKVARGELGVDRLPSPSQRIANANASPASTAPRSNLPVIPTPLIGRQREVQELSQLLRDPQCRLLTLVGPGGVGKTRLAIETASLLQVEFGDGVYFVPLASINSTRFIVPVIADALGFPFQGTNRTDPKVQLLSYLSEKQILLLADNLEQLLAEPGIEVLADLLASAPRVKLLTTSREPVGLQVEWVFEVGGLPVPDDHYAEESAQNASVELFLQRARRAYVGFNATVEDYPAIVRICRLLAGIPLAIELAATWVRTLSCEEIALEIERGLDFLSGPARDLPARHRSVRAVFDHSWALLSPQEQAVLLHLSVFEGGFRREAAEQVAGATLSLLSALVTKSLIRRSGAGRYDLHELICQFAAERLAEQPEEQAATRVRHARFYLTFFGQADGRLRSSIQRETLAELTAEMDNFRAAWDWAVESGEFALIEGAVRTLGMFYHTRGWWVEGLDVLGRGISVLETAGEPSAPDRTQQVALGHLLAIHALLTSRMGLYEQAQAMLERSVNILRPLQEPRVLVEPIAFLGLAMEYTGNNTRALELYSEGLEIATTIGDEWFAALCLTLRTNVEGITLQRIGLEETYARFQTAVEEWRRIGDPTFTAVALSNFSMCAMSLGRYESARAALDESVNLCSSVGERWELGFVYRGLGLVAQAQGEHPQALIMFQKSLDTFTELGSRHEMARVLVDMSRSLFALGMDAESERTWRDSFRLAIETQGTFIAMEALAGLASLEAKQGDIEHALELLWVVLNHPASAQDTRSRADQLRFELEEKLTNPQAEAALAHARAKTFELVVQEVLRQD